MASNGVHSLLLERTRHLFSGVPLTPDDLSPRAKGIYDKVKVFIENELMPIEAQLYKYAGDVNTMWTENSKLVELRVRFKRNLLKAVLLTRSKLVRKVYGICLSRRR